jgi:hypothetical protein
MQQHNKLTMLTCLLSLFFCMAVQAQTTVSEKHTIISHTPASVNCTVIVGHWEGDTWIDTQNVCKYENRMEGVAWVQDYWVCTVFTADGNCSTWEYRPGHWLKTFP